MSDQMPDVRYLEECFLYDPETGSVKWKARPPHHFGSVRAMNIVNGKLAGKEIINQNKGYIRAGIMGRNIAIHRIVFAFVNGRWPNMVDHINGNSLDNRACNLREVTASENQRNAKKKVVRRNAYDWGLLA